MNANEKNFDWTDHSNLEPEIKHPFFIYEGRVAFVGTNGVRI